MSAGAQMMVLATVLALGVLALLIFTTVKSIINERTKGPLDLARVRGAGADDPVLHHLDRTWHCRVTDLYR